MHYYLNCHLEASMAAMTKNKTKTETKDSPVKLTRNKNPEPNQHPKLPTQKPSRKMLKTDTPLTKPCGCAHTCHKNSMHQIVKQVW